MKLRKAVMKNNDPSNWFIWSINVEEKSVTCLPYGETDDLALFVHDLKTFPMSELILN